MQKHKDKIKLHISRIISLRRGVLFPAIIASVSILLVELHLKYIPARGNLLYDLGQVYLKLCYSFIAASIFYFIVVHLPLERKRARLYRYIRSKVARIDTEIHWFIDQINRTSGSEIVKSSSGESVYNDACTRINPQGKLQTFEYHSPFSNWFEYIKFKCDRLKELTFELIALGDGIDSTLLQALTFLDDRVTSIKIISVASPNNSDLTALSASIYEIVQNANRVLEALNENYEKYLPEHQIEYRSEMRRRSKVELKKSRNKGSVS